MNAQEKRLRELEQRLGDKNTDSVINTIMSLRDEEACTGAIRLLAELFDKSTEPSIKSNISAFMNDMKEKSLCIEVVTEIKKKYKSETTKMLVSSCWQSGLDYARYASDFALVFERGDYETAIECFSVIESNLPGISKQSRDHIIILLKESEGLRNSAKSALMEELVDLLSRA